MRENQYLESDSNKVVQLFVLFDKFLYTWINDCKTNELLHSIFVDIRLIYARALIDFFGTKKQEDDLCYKDFIHTEDD